MLEARSWATAIGLHIEQPLNSFEHTGKNDWYTEYLWKHPWQFIKLCSAFRTAGNVFQFSALNTSKYCWRSFVLREFQLLNFLRSGGSFRLKVCKSILNVVPTNMLENRVYVSCTTCCWSCFGVAFSSRVIFAVTALVNSNAAALAKPHLCGWIKLVIITKMRVIFESFLIWVERPYFKRLENFQYANINWQLINNSICHWILWIYQ